jgi:hypothetical protein
VTEAVSGNAIAHELRRRIAAQGQITVAEFMELALGDNYDARDTQGVAGE